MAVEQISRLLVDCRSYAAGRVPAWFRGNGLNALVSRLSALTNDALRITDPAQREARLQLIKGILTAVRQDNPAAADRIEDNLARTNPDASNALDALPPIDSYKGISDTPAMRKWFRAGNPEASTLMGPEEVEATLTDIITAAQLREGKQ
jgi:hypothetical protein